MSPVAKILFVTVLVHVGLNVLWYKVLSYGETLLHAPLPTVVVLVLVTAFAVEPFETVAFAYCKVCLPGSERRARALRAWHRLVLAYAAILVCLVVVSAVHTCVLVVGFALVNLALLAWFFFTSDDGWPHVRDRLAKAVRSVIASLRPASPAAAGSRA